MDYDLVDRKAEPLKKRSTNTMNKRMFYEIMGGLAEAIKSHTADLEKRIERLESDLEYARSQAAKCLDADLDKFISPPEGNDGPTLTELDEMARKQAEFKTGENRNDRSDIHHRRSGR